MAYIPTTSSSDPGSGGGGGFDSFLSNNSGLIGSLVGGAGGLLAGLLGNNNSVPYEGAIGAVAGAAGNEAAGLYNTGQTLINPLISGQLPPGAEAVVQQMVQKENADTKGRYASLGLTGSTMETDALNNVQQAATAQQFQIAQQMAQAGISLTGQSLQGLQIESSTYESLMKAQMQQNQGLFNSISGFMSALGGAAAKGLPAMMAA